MLEVLKTNPFYGKRYVLLGRMTEYERQSVDETMQKLGAIKRKSVSSTTNFVITGEYPGKGALQKAEELYCTGYDITRITVDKIIEVSSALQTYGFDSLYDNPTSQVALFNRINTIIRREKEKAGFEPSAYAAFEEEQALIEQKEYEEKKKNYKVWAAIFSIIVTGLLFYFFGLGIFLIIGLFAAFPAIMGKMLGKTIRSLLK